MSATTLLTELQAAGVRLVPFGYDRLTVDAPAGVITAEMRTALRQHKSEIITLLQVKSEKIQEIESIELLYVFRERAAIMEIDGGMLRKEAEWLAAHEVFDVPEKLRAYAEQHPAIKFLLQRGGEIVDVQFSECRRESTG